MGRVLLEGGPTLAQAFLAEGLVDEFHRFLSAAPAGGTRVNLPTEALKNMQAQADWPGGRWEVWR